jgi:hypothetical protein
MSTQAKAIQKWDPWQPQPVNQVDGAPTIFRGSVTNHYEGDIEGDGSVEFVIIVLPDGSGPFWGLERIVGRLGGQSGSFVLRHEGVLKAPTATAKWSVVPGSGSGALAGLRGEGDYTTSDIRPGGHASVTLSYELA